MIKILHYDNNEKRWHIADLKKNNFRMIVQIEFVT